ncbi:MAG: hypothetical protein ABI432_19045 [Flavobacteriales bacterium]
MKSKYGEWLRFGGAFGYSFRTDDELRSTEDPFTVVTTAEQGSSPFIAPEIGFTREDDRGRIELGLRYLYHLDRSPAWTSVSTSTGGSATFTGTDDHIALVLRYHFGFNRPELPPLPLPDVDYVARLTDTLTTLPTHRDRITLVFWDNAEYDGDTISVLLNEETVLSHYELTGRKKKLRLDLRRGTNTLLVVAHNEGRVPPNTASCIVHAGRKRTQLLLRTSNRTNQAVVLQRE